MLLFLVLQKITLVSVDYISGDVKCNSSHVCRISCAFRKARVPKIASVLKEPYCAFYVAVGGSLHLYKSELSVRKERGEAAGRTAAEYLRYFQPANRLRQRELERVKAVDKSS